MNINHWSKHHHYKKILLFILSVVIVFLLSQIPYFREAILGIGDWGYFGAIAIGFFYVITFTTVPALAVLYNLSLFLNPIELSLLAGVGSVIGDLVMFKLFKNKSLLHFHSEERKTKHSSLQRALHKRYLTWLTPILGALIIASPIPDELGISLLSVSKIKQWQFIILTYILDSVGIYLLLTGLNLVFN